MLLMAGLIIYISALNLAIWEGFDRARLEQDLKILRQDLEERQEFFMAGLNFFYEQNALLFSPNLKNSPQFVSREQNVARISPGFTQ